MLISLLFGSFVTISLSYYNLCAYYAVNDFKLINVVELSIILFWKGKIN